MCVCVCVFSAEVNLFPFLPNKERSEVAIQMEAGEERGMKGSFLKGDREGDLRLIGSQMCNKVYK